MRLTARWPALAAIVPFIPVVALWWIVTEAGVFPRAFLPGPVEVVQLVRHAGLQGHPAGIPAGQHGAARRRRCSGAWRSAFPLGVLVGISRRAHTASVAAAAVLPGHRRHRLAADPADLVRLRPDDHDVRDRLHGDLSGGAEHGARACARSRSRCIARPLAASAPRARACFGKWCCPARCPTS